MFWNINVYKQTSQVCLFINFTGVFIYVAIFKQLNRWHLIHLLFNVQRSSFKGEQVGPFIKFIVLYAGRFLFLSLFHWDSLFCYLNLTNSHYQNLAKVAIFASLSSPLNWAFFRHSSRFQSSMAKNSQKIVVIWLVKNCNHFFCKNYCLTPH